MFSININSYKYPGCNFSVLKEIYLKLSKQGLYYVYGDNGSGKTTLSLILFGIIPNVIKGKLDGEVTFKDSPINLEVIRESYAYLFQNPMDFFSGLSPRDELSYLNNPDSLVQDLVSDINLDLPFSKLSTGQQQKVAIASIMNSNKSYLLLDEPFEFIDDESLVIVHKLIQNKINEGKFILIVDHLNQMRYKAENFSNIILLENGQILNNKPVTKIDDFIFTKPISPKISTFSADNLYFKFEDQNDFFLCIPHLILKSGIITGVKGLNGSGKTTLFYILSGLMKCKKASFFLNGVKLKYKDLRKIVKLSTQNPNFQLFHSTIYNEIKFALRLSEKTQNYIDLCISKAKTFLPFDLNVDPASLSYGQKKILTIYITYLIDSDIIILDEPFASLDFQNINFVFKLLNDMLLNNKTVIVSSHNVELLKRCSHNIFELKNGNLYLL